MYFMQHTEEWWHRMVDLHTKLIEHYDADILEEFKHELDSINYVYAKPYEGLGKGAPPISEITYWFENASKWSAIQENYDAALTYLERALDYYCDPVLNYDDETIEDAKGRMNDLVTKTIIGIYEGCHELND